jgi:hypothetical protein
MPNEKARAAPKRGSQQVASTKTTRNSVPDSSYDASNNLAAPVLGDRGEYHCGGCNHEADYAFRIDRYTRKPTWFVGNAFTTRCPKRGDCLKLHCGWLAELGIEVTPEQLLTDPRPALLAAGARASRDDKPPPPLPGLGSISGWHSALMSYPLEPLEYLLERGITHEAIARYQIGWDRDRQRLTFPMRGGLLKTRPARDGAQMRCWPGKDRPWPLYPDVSREAGWVVLVAGELDALCGISAGLPAVSVTLGAGTWRPEWTDELRGLYILVAFDNNEAALARWRVKELHKAGIRAGQLDLRTLGLNTPKGDLSDYLNSGGDPKRIKPPGRRTS